MKKKMQAVVERLVAAEVASCKAHHALYEVGGKDAELKAEATVRAEKAVYARIDFNQAVVLQSIQGE